MSLKDLKQRLKDYLWKTITDDWNHEELIKDIMILLEDWLRGKKFRIPYSLDKKIRDSFSFKILEKIQKVIDIFH